jgi:general secretion pathway protein F
MNKTDASVTKALHSLRTQLDAGINMAEALALSATLCTRAPARACFAEASTRATNGQSIERMLDALAPLLTEGELSTLEAGWKGGRAEAMLGAVVEQRELWETARAKIRAQMLQPALTLLLASAVAPLPAFVQGGGLATYLFFALLPLAVAFLLWRLYSACMSPGSHSELKSALDRIKLKLPILCRVERNRNLAEFSTCLSNLQAAGLNIASALETCAHAASNELYAHDLAAASLVVRKGNPLTSALRPSPLWPPEFLAALRVGEASGALDETLARQARVYRDNYVRAVEAFSVWLPRLIYAVIALFVIIIILKFAFGYISLLNSVLPEK